MRTHYTFDLGIKMRKETGVTEQHPVKEKYIVYFHDIKHCDESAEEFQEAEAVFTPSHTPRTKAPANSKKAIAIIMPPMIWAL